MFVFLFSHTFLIQFRFFSSIGKGDIGGCLMCDTPIIINCDVIVVVITICDNLNNLSNDHLELKRNYTISYFMLEKNYARFV